MKRNPYEQQLDKNAANYAPLTPLSFLERAAHVYPDRLAVIHGAQRATWRQTYERSRRLAHALARRGLGVGDTVAAMLPNIPAMYEAHFGVPMSGAVLNALNTRLDADAIAFMLNHGNAKLILVDREFAEVIEKAISKINREIEVIDVEDPEYAGPGRRLGSKTYEELLAGGDPAWEWRWPADEWQAISLNYTSGTTGNPKGVVYHHRGAYLNGVGNILVWGMPQHSVYLWTLPMFHCNGWCFPWTMAANAGTSVCLRRVDAQTIFRLIKQHRVTHYCGAPVVHQMLVNAPEEMKQGISHQVSGLVAAAAPPAAMIEGLQKMGFSITHVYGLTETYGPATVCAKHPEWGRLPLAEQARLNARQGVRYHVEEGLSVMDPQTMRPVPADGETMGEIMFRGNITMKGYLKNPQATQEAFAGGWFHSGDLAVMQPDGYVKIKDRSKDIIISGGENISSLEVEDILYRHPAVLAAAVVAKPDAKWGETPCAFVELKPHAEASEMEIIEFCRGHLAGFKAPRAVVFGELPKTSTGKIQKFLLREKARSTSAIDT
ncbi:MAG: acyl-CoA synthetase [Betaproteobacteria bacterium]|nr:MAG: acyl-CoA synthetase [Betaproteobacteria bacterium]